MFIKPLFMPTLRFAAAGDDEGGSSNDEPQIKLNDHGYPDGTPWKDMEPEHQTNYWRHQARKHEKNRKPDNFDDIVSAAQKWNEKQNEDLPADERALNDARQEGKKEGMGAFLHDAVRAELRALRPHLSVEELDEFLEDVALPKFMTSEGRLDVERVKRLADKLATDPGNGEEEEPTPPPVTLGDILSRSNKPGGKTGSVSEARERTLAKYQTKSQ